MFQLSEGGSVRHPGASNLRKIIVAILVAAVVLIAGCIAYLTWPGGTADGHSRSVSRSGGTVRSLDGALSVTFAPGQLPSDTRVTIKKNVDGPPPIVGFRPLTRPFDIQLGHPAKGGTVTARYRLPADVQIDPSLIVMFIEDQGAWKIVPRAVDPAKQVVVGRWPHFSKGFVGFFDTSFHTVGKAAVTTGHIAGGVASWSWDKVKEGASWTKDAIVDTAASIASGVVGGAGGTTDVVKCDPDGGYWKFTNSTGMTGCAGPQSDNGNGSWPAKVNDRYPYPLIAPLPEGAIGPGWKDLADSTELVDLISSMVASRQDQLIIPAGKTVPLRFMPDAPAKLTVSAQVEPYSMAAKVVELAAIAFTDGIAAADLAIAKAEITATEAELEAAFLAARKAGSATLTLAEYIEQTQGEHSLLAMQKRALHNDQAAYAVNKMFSFLGLANCAMGITGTANKKGESLAGKIKAGVEVISDQCLPQFASAIVECAFNVATSLLDPDELASVTKAMVKAILSDAKNLAGVVASNVATSLKDITLGQVDLTTAKLVAERPGVNITIAVRDAILAFLKREGVTKGGDPSRPNIADYGDDWIRYGGNLASIIHPGQPNPVKIDCGGDDVISAGSTALCRHYVHDGLFVVVRVANGSHTEVEAMVMTGGGSKEICSTEWARRAVISHGKGLNCS